MDERDFEHSLPNCADFAGAEATGKPTDRHDLICLQFDTPAQNELTER